jgi:hypothetical protein
MKIKTSELTEAVLDWAVGKCEGDASLGWTCGGTKRTALLCIEKTWRKFSPSTNWAQGKPIIEREAIQLTPDEYTQTWSAYTTNEGNPYECVGTTPLIAAMRCYIASKLGDEVEIPKELT